MKTFTNDALIKRNARIGQITSFGGLIVLAVGLVLSYRNPEQIGLSWLALLIGFILSQVGIYFGNRWARRPRPDETIDKALKGLSRNYSLFNYSSPADHLLIGPAGIWVLAPRNHRGEIIYQNGRWKQVGGGLRMLFLKVFAQEGLGQPDRDLYNQVERVQRALTKELDEQDMPPINAALIFTNEEVTLEVEDAPYPAMPDRNLKTFLRKRAKEGRLSDEKAERYQEFLHKG